MRWATTPRCASVAVQPADQSQSHGGQHHRHARSSQDAPTNLLPHRPPTPFYANARLLHGAKDGIVVTVIIRERMKREDAWVSGHRKSTRAGLWARWIGAAGRRGDGDGRGPGRDPGEDGPDLRRPSRLTAPCRRASAAWTWRAGCWRAFHDAKTGPVYGFINGVQRGARAGLGGRAVAVARGGPSAGQPHVDRT